MKGKTYSTFAKVERTIFIRHWMKSGGLAVLLLVSIWLFWYTHITRQS
ncbi:MAG: hypothetical protein QG664_744, partial [Patescibacteria group bacterium]|nr:hypothetical protein [Patescibacteria group bacterium]